MERVEARALWDEEKALWKLPKAELAGNSRRARPTSDDRMRLPESEFARRRANFDPNPRFKAENVATLELDMPERTTMDYTGAAMSRRVEMPMSSSVLGDDEELVPPEAAAEKAKVRKERPRTASKKKPESPRGDGDYPVARGMVGRG